MSAPIPSRRAGAPPLVPAGAEWVVAPLPLVFALIARFLGPADAREIAADLMLLVHFQLFLPALALAAVARVCFGHPDGARTRWGPGLALLASAAGALAGQLLVEPRSFVAGTQLAALVWSVGLAVPFWAWGMLVGRYATRWRALGLTAAILALSGATAVVATLALYLSAFSLGNGLLAGGTVATVLALALARWRPARLAAPARLVLLAATSAVVPAVALLIWFGTPPAGAFIPVHVYSPAQADHLLVKALSPRDLVPRVLSVPLDGGPPRRLPRRVADLCALDGERLAVYLAPLGAHLGLPLTSPRLGVLEGDRLTVLGATAPGAGLLKCSGDGAVLYHTGPTMDVWDPATERRWHVEAPGSTVLFACFTVNEPGILYRLRGEEPPPYPRRLLPLAAGATPLSGPEVDGARCTEGEDRSATLWVQSPLPHSGAPWRIHDPVSGTVVEIEDRVERISYTPAGRTLLLLSDARDETRLEIWAPGRGREVGWPTSPGNRIYSMRGGEEILIVNDDWDSRSPPWRLHRAADGAVLREGTSDDVWPVADRDLVELRDGELVLHDLHGDGSERRLLPREEEPR